MTEQIVFYEDFVTVTPGEPIKLFPLASIFKNGEERTAETIAALKLPHFKPAIKLGSHADDAPAAGHINSLETKDGYLWGLPEWTEKGLRAIQEGDFRYNSPEVIWEGGLEDPDTGKVIDGPLIVGDALLHMPHLGDATALYSTEQVEKESEMSEDNVTVPVSWLDKLIGRNEPEPQPEPEPQAEPQVDDFEAKYQAEREQVELLEAQIAQFEADNKRTERVANFAAELAETPSAEDEELHGLLADLDDEIAGKLMTKFKALGAQAEQADLETDLGVEGDPNAGDPDAAFHAAIEARANEDSISYAVAAGLVARDNPELYKDWGGK